MPEKAASAAPSPAEHVIKPLPFDPARIEGLSERLLVSHHQNNYGGAVKRLNLIEQRIRELPADAAPFQMGSLKREQLIARNSMVLHELYFANLGGSGGATGALAESLQKSFGSLQAWEKDFRLTGMSLGGGSGWVFLCSDPATGTLFNAWSWDHGHFPAGARPLLVMDMYEHSYHIDYGADAKSYVDAFFRNIRWEEVARRMSAPA
ncbi:MAG TPA: Fe-Mn family superoxide dismutase [Candidatus Limnocylindrales bacterium]|nr:Fe-Mn family superoxide dismutase [Candidatus Limnocylindrales bacterium]